MVTDPCRTVLHHKALSAKFHFINLINKDQHTPDYVAVNPSHSVPTLIAENGKLKLTQSVAIMEYLEERYPERPLLPKDIRQRALVRNLVNVLSNDTQPIANLRILVHVEKIGGDRAQWAKDYLQSGLDGIFSYGIGLIVAYEVLVKESAGLYSVGDEVSMADIALTPTVEAALRWGVDFTVLPTVWGIYDRLKVLPQFEKGDWRHQEDTPEQFRV
jgi:maleylacetoacetate isomerase